MAKGNGGSRGSDKTHNIVSKQEALDFLSKYAASPNSGFEDVRKIIFCTNDDTNGAAYHSGHEIGINQEYNDLYLDGK